MQDFKCVTDTIYSMQKVLEEIQAILDETYSQAALVNADLNLETNWAGETQLVGAAFMNLVLQYHEKLAGDGEGPVKQASDAFQKYLDNDSVFYDNWAEYQDVLSM